MAARIGMMTVRVRDSPSLIRIVRRGSSSQRDDRPCICCAFSDRLLASSVYTELAACFLASAPELDRVR